jgi:hypothetical protein
MRVAVLLLLVCFATTGRVAAFDWPVKKVILSATFGEDRGDHFHSGIDLAGGEQDVLPIAAGEVVFSFEEGEDQFSVPVGLGSFLVLQHQGGVRSLYGHLQKGSMDRKARNLDGSKPLGRVGETGYSVGKHLHLVIIDSEMRSLINPLLVLPPLSDRQSPAIREIFLRSGSELLPLKSGVQVKPGNAEVLATLYDLREDVAFAWRLAPYRISLYQDGREIASLLMDGLHERPAKSGGPELALLQSNLSFREVYDAQWVYRLGELRLLPGQTTLNVIAEDYAGNESSRELVLRVPQ